MYFAYDLHGTITTDPKGFKTGLEILIQTGHKVAILSGSPIKKLKEELSALGFVEGINYSKLLSVTDYLLAKGFNCTIDKNGNLFFEEDMWWQAKARICQEEGIDELVDNDLRYGVYFTDTHRTRFILYEEIQ